MYGAATCHPIFQAFGGQVVCHKRATCQPGTQNPRGLQSCTTAKASHLGNGHGTKLGDRFSQEPLAPWSQHQPNISRVFRHAALAQNSGQKERLSAGVNARRAGPDLWDVSARRSAAPSRRRRKSPLQPRACQRAIVTATRLRQPSPRLVVARRQLGWAPTWGPVLAGVILGHAPVTGFDCPSPLACSRVRLALAPVVA